MSASSASVLAQIATTGALCFFGVGAQAVEIRVVLEAVLGDVGDEDRQLFLAEMGQDEPGLNRLMRAAFGLLGLQTYFTAGVKEVRAWRVRAAPPRRRRPA